MRVTDDARKSCSICLHGKADHYIVKAESKTGCSGCMCRRFVETKVMHVQGDAEPSVKK